MNTKYHWEHVYETKSRDSVSWYTPHLTRSLQLIDRIRGDAIEPHVIDIGAGQSTLVEDLLDRGLNQLTVLDISDKAIHETQTRLRERSSSVHWVVSDILTTSFPPHSFDIWHDRVVFHFLTQSEERSKYVEQLKHALKPSGYVIIATFGPEGPLKCSGLPVCRYDVSALMAEFGTSFELKEHVMEWHETPTAASQQFLYVVMQMK